MNIEKVLPVIKERCLCHPPLTPPIKGGESERRISIERAQLMIPSPLVGEG